jgi:hypothetical protein
MYYKIHIFVYSHKHIRIQFFACKKPKKKTQDIYIHLLKLKTAIIDFSIYPQDESIDCLNKANITY